MNRLIEKSKFWVVAVSLLAFSLSSSTAFAEWHHRGRWGWFGAGVAASALAAGVIVASLPHGYTTVVVDGSPYYYYDDIYYRSGPGGYVVVEAPATAVVRDVPSGYERVVVNGVTYYVNNGVYYTYTSYGYQAVEAPVTATKSLPAVSAPAVAPAMASISEQDKVVTINIPNKRNGFTPVALKRSGKGFVGPQGEYYPEFPTVAQLEVIYGG